MDNRFYLPILKSKLGEFVALDKLDNKWKSVIVPLFEVTPLEWDHSERKVPKKLEDHLNLFCDKIIGKWRNNQCFIDTHLLKWNSSDNRDKINYIYEKLSRENILPYPVIRLDSSASFVLLVQNIIKEYRLPEIGLRILPNNLGYEDLDNKVTALLSALNITPEQTHLILDFQDSNYTEKENFAMALFDVIESFPFRENWKSFTLSGSAFPATKHIQEGHSYVQRNEWQVYLLLTNRLKKVPLVKNLNYSDYSIVNPNYFEFNPKLMKSSANIKYTTNDTWLVVKGKALREAKDYQQYKEMARTIIISENYMGVEFSKGDEHLNLCVKGIKNPGSPNIWNWVGHNHHFTKVLSDLFSRSLVFL